MIDYDGFSTWLVLNDRRNTTIRKHKNALAYIEKNNIPLVEVDLLRFLSELKQAGKKGAYLNSFVDAINLYCRYKNIPIKLKQFKKLPAQKATLADEEIEAFLALPRRSHQPEKHYLRMKMFWSLIAFTGMRPGECAKIKATEIDWGRGVIVIPETKTNQPGVVPIPPNIKDELKKYLSNLETEYLFPSTKGGNHYSNGGIAVIDNVDWHFDWKKRLSALGLIRPHLTPYSFRHSFATRLLEENISLFHVKKLMRHNDLKSTLVYEHLTTKDLIQAIEKLPLVRKGVSPKVVIQHIAEILKNLRVQEDERFNYRLEENDHSIRFELYIK